jgi:protein TorT
MKNTLLTSALLGAGLISFALPAVAQDSRRSIPVELVAEDGTKTATDWPLITAEEITKPWNICVLFPHLKDSYWLATNYGVADQIMQTNTSMTLYAAAGYNDLSTQLDQIDNCIVQGMDGIILGAISADGVGALVKKATDAGIPVIDFINGVNEPSTSAHALVSFYDLAYTTGKYIVEQANGKPLKVGFFPGPQGAGWSDAAVKGFNDALDGSPVEVVVTRRGDTGLSVQLDFISNALLTYDGIDWIVGVDIAAEAGAIAVRNAGLIGQVDVAAFDIIPPVYRDIKAGATKASPTDFTVLQGRLAVDMVLRLLEGQELMAKRAGPKPEMVTTDNYDTFELSDMFAPDDFKVIFSVDKGK